MTAHKHAALMAQYAQDAAETDKPWLRWEYKRSTDVNTWFPATLGFGWLPEFDYRRKLDPVKTETRTYECWAHVDGYLHWREKGSKMAWPEQWNRVPSLDKTAEVTL